MRSGSSKRRQSWWDFRPRNNSSSSCLPGLQPIIESDSQENILESSPLRGAETPPTGGAYREYGYSSRYPPPPPRKDGGYWSYSPRARYSRVMVYVWWGAVTASLGSFLFYFA